VKTTLSRRQFLKVFGITGTTAVLAACSSAATPTAAPSTEATAAPAATTEATAAATAAGTAATTAPAASGSEPMLSSQMTSPVKFSYLRPVWGPATHQKGAAYELELFKRANVEIESQIVPVFDYETKFPVLVAGGTMADIMWHAGPSWGPAYDLIQQGAFLPLDDLLAKYPEVKGAVSDGLWDMIKSPDGKHYFFPNPLSNWVPFPVFYRTDVFKELNIAEPTTIDELVAALKVIKEKKPDMVPFTAQEYSLWIIGQNLAVSFGYGFDNWTPDPTDTNKDNPSKIVPSRTTTQYKDFLAWLQMLRKEELLDPDFLVATGKKGVDKFTAGQAAVMTGNWNGYADWQTELKKAVATGDIGVMPALKGPAGPMGCCTLTGYDRGFSIASQSKDKADNIFKFLNWAYTEGYDFMQHGLEGKTFTVDADGNKISILDSEREAGFKAENIEPFGFPPKAADTVPNNGQSWFDLHTLYKTRGLEDKVPMIRKMFEDQAANSFPNYNRNTYSPTAGKKGDQLYQQYIKPMEEKIVIDPTVALTTWDDGIKNWLDNGGNDIIKETNEIQKEKSKPVVKYEYKGKDYK
jgi:hypothetical protein